MSDLRLPPGPEEVFSQVTRERMRICDALLAERAHDSARIANAFLHFKGIRETDLQEHEQSLPKALWRSISHTVLDQLRLARDLAMGTDRELPEVHPVDVLFVSHFLGQIDSALGERRDAYFGSLPDALDKVGITTAVIAIDQTAHARWKSGHGTVVLPRRAKRRCEIRFALQLFTDACRLLLTAFGRDAQRGSGSIVLLAAISSLSAASRMNLRLGYQISRLVGQTQASNAVITFEGNAWERSCALSIRMLRRHCRVTGYQHAPAVPGLHALFRPITRQTDPDIILCSSRAGETLLKHGWRETETEVRLVGLLSAGSSVLRVGSGLQSSSTQVLLTPDGTFGEIRFFLTLALRLAVECPSIKFVCRLHPVATNCKEVRKFASHFRGLSNLTISSSSIRDDLEEADLLLYRNSGVSLLACLLSDARLAFVGSNPNLDPLWNLHSFNDMNVDGLTDFMRLLRNETNYQLHWEPDMHQTHKLGLQPDLDLAVKYLSSAHPSSPL